MRERVSELARDTAWLDVDLGAIQRNFARLYARASVPLIAMVKADAYGLGMVNVVRALTDQAHRPTDSLWGVGIVRLDEAETLRASGFTGRVLCCAPLGPSELPDAVALAVRPALHRPAEIDAWHALGGGAWHLSIDTGMSRAGASWRETIAHPNVLTAVLRRCPPEGIFTHFHSADVADESASRQEQYLESVRHQLRDALPPRILVHTDNSAAIARRRSGSPGDLARPGIALYGASLDRQLGLEMTVHMRARIIDLRDVEDGDSVSYAATWHASSKRRIATVPVGYADGFRQALSNRADGLVHGMRCPVVGRVTMDLTMLDVTDVACELGDVVTLLGRDGDTVLTIDEVAARGELSAYELLVGLKLRLPRRYSGGN